MKALLSVSDKRGIIELASALQELGFEILSTGGTLKALCKAHILAMDVASYTQSPELFHGRVKTLHPKIHGGILYRRNHPEDVANALAHGISEIALVCVNLYPFDETSKKSSDITEIVEQIDIGGPSLLRAGAKAYEHVLVLSDPSDYAHVITCLREGKNTLDLRKAMMIKAFQHTAHYDMVIANYFSERFEGGFGERVFLSAKKVLQTSYGENPHQKGALYEFEDFWSRHLRVIKGELSFNNFTDIHSAIKLATYFGGCPAVSIIKHGNPCGFAIKEHVRASYSAALACDSVSAYGGVVAVNGVIDESLAADMAKNFIEVLVASAITQEALAIFASKKRMKIVLLPAKKGIDANITDIATCSTTSTISQSTAPITPPKSTSIDERAHLAFFNDGYDFKHISGGFLYQQSDSIMRDEVEQAICKTHIQASKEQLADLHIAYVICALSKSNSVAYVKNGALIAIGMGMTSRVDASRAALAKARDMGLDMQGSVMASEAFFPFRDSVDMAASVGVRAIIQPGGSMRDDEVIAAANEHGMALYFTGVRHFLH